MKWLFCSLMTLALAGTAHAQSPKPVIVGASYTVNNGAGSQTDPHVSGELVAYSNDHSPNATPFFSEIRFHVLSTGMDQAIPNGGAYDYLSGVSGQRIVFTRIHSNERSIHIYDVASATTSELLPKPGAFRDAASIGGNTVAWADYGLQTAATAPEIVVHDLSTKATTALTANSLEDGQPNVAPNGDVVVFRQCAAVGSCDILQATRSATGWSVAPLTSASGDETAPATDGATVAYESLRNVNGLAERDIYFQAVGGSPEAAIPLPGVQQNPSVAGGLIAFESAASTGFGGGNFDLLLYDTNTATLYQLTQTPENETLSDIDVDPGTGVVRVVFVRNEAGDENVYAFSFRLEEAGPCREAPTSEAEYAAACAAPGSRPLLAQLSLTRTFGFPDYAFATFAAPPGVGLLCVDNGQPTGSPAVSGRVDFNGATVVHPSWFQMGNHSLAGPLMLSATNVVEASVAGQPGSSFSVRVYGAEVCMTGTELVTQPPKGKRPVGLYGPGRPHAHQIHGRLLEAVDGGHTVPVEVASDDPTQGCASAGSSLVIGCLFAWMLLLVSPRRRFASQRVGSRRD